MKFNDVFNSSCNQKDIFENCIPILNNFLNKYISTTIFAYGQTSSGKTYTIFGNKDN